MAIGDAQEWQVSALERVSMNLGLPSAWSLLVALDLKPDALTPNPKSCICEPQTLVGSLEDLGFALT